MFCKNCGAENPKGTTFCTSCGATLSEMKYCQHCGEQIDAACVICPKCGKRVETVKSEPPTPPQPTPQPAPQVVINNTNTNAVYANPYAYGRAKNKWVAFFLCLFLGILGAHKFYEGKVGMGILYLFTGGLFVIGVIVDLIAILGKPRLYY